MSTRKAVMLPERVYTVLREIATREQRTLGVTLERMIQAYLVASQGAQQKTPNRAQAPEPHREPMAPRPLYGFPKTHQVEKSPKGVRETR